MSDLKQIEALRRAAQKIDELQSLSQENQALKEENKRLKEALGFYADEDNWTSGRPDSEIDLDRGVRARSALKEE